MLNITRPWTIAKLLLTPQSRKILPKPSRAEFEKVFFLSPCPCASLKGRKSLFKIKGVCRVLLAVHNASKNISSALCYSSFLSPHTHVFFILSYTKALISSSCPLVSSNFLYFFSIFFYFIQYNFEIICSSLFGKDTCL